MLKTLAISAALMMLAGSASAQKLDANGKCHAADGKMAKMEICKPPGASPANKCRDVKTKKFAKCGTPGTEAVPMKK